MQREGEAGFAGLVAEIPAAKIGAAGPADRSEKQETGLAYPPIIVPGASLVDAEEDKRGNVYREQCNPDKESQAQLTIQWMPKRSISSP